MKTALLLAFGLGLAAQCGAQRTVMEFDWQELAQGGQLLGGQPATLDGRTVLRIAHTNDAPLQQLLLTIARPSVSNQVYALVGRIKYEGVQGEGFLEMWSCFAAAVPGQPESRYFSRTLAPGGPLGKIAGTSDWREVVLPFDQTGAAGVLTRLELKMVLPGRGTVYLGPLKLVETRRGLAGLLGGRGWWSDQAAGLIGGIGGSVLGCLGGLLSWLAAQGKARGFVLASSWGLIVLGALSGAAGLVALLLRQPYAVWFVLLLVGVLLLGILPFRLRQYLRQYRDLELRKMAAADALKA